MIDNVFAQIGLIVGLATVGGALAQLLRQPLIVAFIAVGILLGPSALDIVTHSSEIELFARLGIALLLFVVGLKLDLHIIRTVGPVALASGLGQVIFTSLVGYLIALMLGMTYVTAIYVAVALTFSTSIIIVKLLSDKREVDSLHGGLSHRTGYRGCAGDDRPACHWAGRQRNEHGHRFRCMAGSSLPRKRWMAPPGGNRET